MGTLVGESTVEIAADIERCWSIAADLERAPEWQTSLRDVDVLERDEHGRPVLVETVSDAKAKTVRAVLRFSFEPHTAIRCVQERGEVKALQGGWSFDELDAGLTRATYMLEVDPGRMLGMLLRGPAVDRVRQVLVGDAARELKLRAEQG